MANFGEALAALDDFRAQLVDRQQAALPDRAVVFRASRSIASGASVSRVHATGVGVVEGKERPGPGDFVIKVYMFNEADVSAARSDGFLRSTHHGIDVEAAPLPVQMALHPTRAARGPKPGASKPSQHQKRHRPVPGGVEIGPLGGSYVGTLGCFVRRGTADDAPLYLLSNNHVLADVNRLPPGTRFTQPYSTDPDDVIATLADFEPVLFPAPGSQPRNVIDAAIAAITDPKQAKLGSMLGIKKYTPELLAPRPGMAVTKSGRTTGVTTGTIRAIRVRGVQVNYGTIQNPIIATFDNTITITGADGAAFSQPGDSGSVILDAASGRPVALLFAGDDTTTTACDLAAACARFSVHPV
jgi:hypothetical protein